MSKLFAYHAGNEPSPIVQLCIDSARRYNDNFYLLDRNQVREMGGGNLIDMCRQKSLPLWAEADLIRWWLVYEFGGAWTDTDVLFLQPLDFQASDAEFVGYRNAQKKVSVALFAAKPKSEIVKWLFDYALREVKKASQGQNQPYGYTALLPVSHMMRDKAMMEKCFIADHYRYQKVPYGNVTPWKKSSHGLQGQWKNPFWNPSAVCYHLTNLAYRSFKNSSRQQLLTGNSFLSFLLQCSFNTLHSHYGKLAEIIRQNNFTRGVEVGVNRGWNSAVQLQQNNSLQLTMVDLWRKQRGGDDGSFYLQKGTHVLFSAKDSDFEGFFQHAMKLTEFAKDRRAVIRERSVDAANKIDKGSQDFVFIDADHSYDGCLADIKAWKEKVKPGGILCGHDYSEKIFPGVVQAVKESFPDFKIGAGTVWQVQC